MKKELLLLGLLSLGGISTVFTKSIHTEEIQGCEAIVVENTLFKRGVTLPLLFGDSIIIYDGNKSLLEHEKGHSEQICGEGIIFAANYFKNREFYEKDADKRMIEGEVRENECSK